MRYLSLFSGIEAATVAWHPLGWECAAVAEIEPFPSAVLAHHYPNVPNLGDVTKITEEQVKALGHIDIVVFGSPCQDLSVAGHRKGLFNADGTVTRSGLFFTAINIARWSGARFWLWENVPGAYSSNKGCNFASVVEFMAGLDTVDVPPRGWATEGVAVGDNGLLEWACLDAQWFGVAQRRRRVFALLDTGDWVNRPPVLLEPESLRGDSAPRREAGKDVAGGAASSFGLRSANTSSNGWGISEELAHTLDQAQPHAIAQPLRPGTDLQARGRKWPADVSCTLNAHYSDKQELENQHALNGAELFVPVLSNDPAHAICVNEQKTYTNEGSMFQLRNVVAQPAAFSIMPMNSGKDYKAREADVAQPLMAGGPVGGNQGGDYVVQPMPLAFTCKDHGADAGEIAPTLRSMSHDGSHANGGGQLAVGFVQNQRNECRITDVIGALQAEPGMKQQAYLAVQSPPISFGFPGNWIGRAPQNGSNQSQPNEEHAPRLTKTDRHGVMTPSMQVRRLTPTECERLQGFPDGYTTIPWRGKPADQCPDGPRYKALGNSMAVPVMAWIGEQIQRAMW